MTQLTSKEAAARLGVKRQTLYAYVSRGLLHRTLSLDGRTSLFDQNEVDTLRRRNRPKKGEVGATIVTSITQLADDGHSYRGRRVTDLLADDLDFEHVVDLVLGGDVPADSASWQPDPVVLSAVQQAQQMVPVSATLLNRLALTVTIASSHDPLRQDVSPRRAAQCARQIIALMVLGLPAQSVVPKPGNLADELWTRLAPTPGTRAKRRALNAALVLLVDHGIAASTFSARIAASVRSHPYAIVLAGLGPAAGAHHGAASANVHRFFQRAAEIGARAAAGERLAANESIPGAGHAVYTVGDRREVDLLALVATGWKRDKRLGVVNDVRSVIADQMSLVPNIDLALGALTWLAGMDPAAGQLFAIARTGGWVAHGIEEFGEAPIRFRPVARYVAPRAQLPEDLSNPERGSLHEID